MCKKMAAYSVVVLQLILICMAYTYRVECATISTCASRGMYSAYSDGFQTCKPCSRCPRGQYINKTCSHYTDTVCGNCPRGTYSRTPDSVVCTPCKHCQPGDYLRRNCTRSRDRKCAKCPERTYSSDLDSQKCRPCKPCKLFEKVVDNCSAKHDYTCGDCTMDYFRDESTDRCLPCSLCYPGETFVIDECFRKLGHSQIVCGPTYYRPVLGKDGTTTTEVNRTIIGNAMISGYSLLLVSMLSVILTSALVLSLVFGSVNQFHRLQKLLRFIRDYRLNSRNGNTSYPEQNVNMCYTSSNTDRRTNSAATDGSLSSIPYKDKNEIRVIISSKTDARLPCQAKTIHKDTYIADSVMSALCNDDDNIKDTVAKPDWQMNEVIKNRTTHPLLESEITHTCRPFDGNCVNYGDALLSDHTRVQRYVGVDGSDRCMKEMPEVNGRQQRIDKTKPTTAVRSKCDPRKPSGDITQAGKVTKTRKKYRKKSMLSTKSLEYICMGNNVYAPLLYNTY